MRAKNVTWSDMARHLKVSDQTLLNWIDTGKIRSTAIFQLRSFFDGYVPDDHWETSPQDRAGAVSSETIAVAEINSSLTGLISQLSDDFKSGLIDEADISALAAMARHLTTRRNVTDIGALAAVANHLITRSNVNA